MYIVSLIGDFVGDSKCVDMIDDLVGEYIIGECIVGLLNGTSVGDAIGVYILLVNGDSVAVYI